MSSVVHPDDLMPHPDYVQLVPAHLLDPPAVHVLPGAVSHLQLRYADVLGWRPLRLDLHVPEGRGPHPVVVYVHGGSFLAGLPAHGPWTALPQQGIAVASVSYRLAGEAPFPQPVEDVRAAVRFVAHVGTRFGLDANRISLWGSSAGGYLAALAAVAGDLGRPIGCREHDATRCLGLPSVQVAAVLLHYPVTAPSKMADDAYDPSDTEAVSSFEAILDAFFVGPTIPVDVADHLGSGNTPPFMLIHGNADRRVGVGQSRRLRDSLSARGVPAELVEVEGADHMDPAFWSDEVVAAGIDFLRRHSG